MACHSDIEDGLAEQSCRANLTPVPSAWEAAYLSVDIDRSHKLRPGLRSGIDEPVVNRAKSVRNGIAEFAQRGD
jgi:hypothetical protein